MSPNPLKPGTSAEQIDARVEPRTFPPPRDGARAPKFTDEMTP
jgi:hypothetical protein